MGIIEIMSLIMSALIVYSFVITYRFVKIMKFMQSIYIVDLEVNDDEVLNEIDIHRAAKYLREEINKNKDGDSK